MQVALLKPRYLKVLSISCYFAPFNPQTFTLCDGDGSLFLEGLTVIYKEDILVVSEVK